MGAPTNTQLLAEIRANQARNDQRWDDAEKVLDEIKDQVRVTNGRVTALENINLVRDGIEADRKEQGKKNYWNDPKLVGIVSAALTALTALLIAAERGAF